MGNSSRQEKESARIEYIPRSRNGFSINITKTAFAKAIKFITDSNLAKLNVPYQTALDEINASWSQENRWNADKEWIFKFFLKSNRNNEFLLRYDIKQDAWYLLSGQRVVMGEEFVRQLACGLLLNTDYFQKDPELPIDQPDEF